MADYTSERDLIGVPGILETSEDGNPHADRGLDCEPQAIIKLLVYYFKQQSVAGDLFRDSVKKIQTIP